MILLQNTGYVTPKVHASVPPSFDDSLTANVSGTPMDMAWTPDGRMLIPVKEGRLLVYSNGALLTTPALDLSGVTCTTSEEGLAGIAVHPNFAINHYIYLYYTFKKSGTCTLGSGNSPANRISRFTLPGNNSISRSSELALVDGPRLINDYHHGGDMAFGNDGYLYASMGDDGTSALGWPQDPGRLLGKILRVTDSGGIPPSNPFVGPDSARCNLNGVPPSGSPSGTKCQEVFALGLRNPFRFAFDQNSPSVRFFINDVGEDTWEEIDNGRLGANYGWPVREGPCATGSTTNCGQPPSGMDNPIYWYGHNVTVGSEFCAAITGGAFVPNGLWSNFLDGTYLYADYICGQIWSLTPDGLGGFIQNEFLRVAPTGLVSMRFGPYGAAEALYYVTLASGGQLRRISPLHDISIAGVAVSRSFAYSGVSGAPIQVNINVANNGVSSESFTVAVKANQTLVATQTPNISAGNMAIVSVSWNTTSLPPGKYLVSAEASPVLGEANLANNIFEMKDYFEVRKAGDVNDDAVVTVDDVLLVTVAWGWTVQNPFADLNNDGVVDLDDVLITLVNWR